MIKILRAKLHGIHVTGSDLDYHGSITLDPLQCGEAGIFPLEFVEIWNKNSGSRLSTYVIFGKPGGGECILNGAAARTCQVGDELIVCASEYVEGPAVVAGRRPVVLMFDSQNRISKRIVYQVGLDSDRFTFAVAEK